MFFNSVCLRYLAILWRIQVKVFSMFCFHVAATVCASTDGCKLELNEEEYLDGLFLF
jgi:hypothetical protein